jgi:hypothetical protein
MVGTSRRDVHSRLNPQLVSKPKPGKFHPNSDVAGGGRSDKQKTGGKLPPVVLEMSDFAD